MNDRHRARRLALQGLCSLDVQGEKVMDLVVDFIKDSEEGLDIVTDARAMLKGAWDDRPTCDKLLTAHARNWDLARLAMVDRNILRLAVHEMLTLKLSPNIVITEALHLAREFSTAESPRFINGVLDAVGKDIAGQTAPEAS